MDAVITWIYAQGYDTRTLVTISIMATIIYAILSVLKIPIKMLTKKIVNEKLRKLANKVIILLAFAIATGAWVLLAHFWPDLFKLDISEILLSGALPVVAYAIGDGIITKQSGKTLLSEMMAALDDGKVSEEEAQNFIKTVKDSTNKNETPKMSEAEEELDNLLKQ